jgi:rubrerythrin
MTTENAMKPPYLGLLNAISIAERNAGCYLKTWADVTPDPELKRALSLVAARETTHGDVFRQRIERLGFSLLDKDDPNLAERQRVYGDRGLSDAEKIRAFRRGPAEEAGVDSFFASIDERVADESVDALTRDTLRWYVHEERDSRELLRAAYARVEGSEPRGTKPPAA